MSKVLTYELIHNQIGKCGIIKLTEGKDEAIYGEKIDYNNPPEEVYDGSNTTAKLKSKAEAHGY